MGTITSSPGLPDPASPMVMQNLVPTQTWFRFFVTLVSKLTPGSAAQPQVTGVSPFTFTATSSGNLLCSGGTVTFSRNGGVTYYPANAANAGGSFFLSAGDIVQVSWSGGAPNIVWMPS